MELIAIVKELGKNLTARKLFLATAESCTGGMVAAAITSIPGSSTCFERGFVTYSNSAKEGMLGVQVNTIEQFGAVSEEVAKEMAEGALAKSHAQVAIAITGIAGPTGGTPEKPVGTVCFAWAQIDKETITAAKKFCGDRSKIRREAVDFVLSEILKFIQ